MQARLAEKLTYTEAFSSHQQRVDIDVDGTIIRGHLRVAAVIVDATIAASYLGDIRDDLFVDAGGFSAEMARWITENKASDDEERTWRERWDSRLSESPVIRAAFDDDPVAVFTQAQLTQAQRDVMLLWWEGMSVRLIAQQLGKGQGAVRSLADRALTAIRQLGYVTLEAIA